MKDIFRSWGVLFAALICLSPAIANASLVGDTVTFEATSSNGNVFPFAPTDAVVGTGTEFTWTPVSSVFNVFPTVEADFGATTLDLIFSIDQSNVTHFGNTTLLFSGLDFSDGSSLTGVNIVQNFDSGIYADNAFAINLLGPDAFELVFSPFAFGTVGFDNPTSDLLQLELVNTVPLPAAAWLFGSALLALFGYSRRRKTINNAGMSLTAA